MAVFTSKKWRTFLRARAAQGRLAVAVLLLGSLCGLALVRAGDEPLDIQRAKQLFQRQQNGEKLSPEDQTYLDHVKQEMRRRSQAKGEKGASGQPAKPGRNLGPVPPATSSTGLIPLTDLGTNKYKGEEGGLYGGGSNEPPAEHRAAVEKQLQLVVPRDANGNPAADGKIVFLSVGMSNTTMEFQVFKRKADADPQKSPHVVIVDGAQGGRVASVWARGAEGVPADIKMSKEAAQKADPWPVVDQRLKDAGVSPQQVQVAWIKHAQAGPAMQGEFPKHAEILAENTVLTLERLRERFPNLRVAYLSSRIYAGYATTALNPEPYAYEGAFAMRWIIQRQIKGDPQLNFAPEKGAVKAPAVLWGPYLWTDGIKPRQTDKLVWLKDDVVPTDRTHPSESGREKVANLLLDFVHHNPLARCWYLRTQAAGAAAESWEKLPNGVLGQVADFEGSGGVRIAGYVRKPAGPGPFPLVIVLHGGAPSARPVGGENEPDRAKRAAAETLRASNGLGRASNPPLPDFLAQGWAVYTVDYRPNPRYKIDPLEIEDTVAAVNKARAFSFVDPQRVAMFGGSHGGHITGRMTSRVNLSCAVVCAPAGLDLIALAHLAEKGAPIGGNQGLVREMEQRSGVKMAEIEKNPQAYHYSSLLTEAAQVRCPILLISGRNDNNAPLPVMDLYSDTLHAAGKQVETYHPDNGPHGFYVGLPHPIPETAESTRRAVAFIKKHFEQATP